MGFVNLEKTIVDVTYFAYIHDRRSNSYLGKEKYRKFEATLDDWSPSLDGNGYFVSLKSIFPGFTINGVVSASISYGGVPPRNVGRVTLELPTTTDNHDFNFEFINGDIIIKTNSTKPDKVYEFTINLL